MNLSYIINKNNLKTLKKIITTTDIPTSIFHIFYSLKNNYLYKKWYHNQVISSHELESQKNIKFTYNPLISIIVPTYNTPIHFLKEMLVSVKNQTYLNWELCIADASKDNIELRDLLISYKNKDSRIKIFFLEDNMGISENTNAALKIANGDFIGLLDHDDTLAPNALYEIVSVLNKYNDIDVLYTDEDKITEDSTTHYYPNFKPDYNKYLLRNYNYICHFFVFSRKIFHEIGYFDPTYDGSQDYYYILTATRIARHVYHIPKILYHWRVHKNSVAQNPQQKIYCYEAGKKALELDLIKENKKGTVNISYPLGFYTTNYIPPSNCTILLITFEKKFSFKFNNFNNYKIISCPVATFHEALYKIKNIKSDYCFILNKGIYTIPNNFFLKSLCHLQYSENGAIAYKITNNRKVVSLGMTYINNKFIGCYKNIPIKSGGYYGRANLNQYVPFCSPYALSTKTKNILSYIKQNNISNFNEFIILFSEYLYLNNKNILGIAEITLSTNFLIKSNSSLINKLKKGSNIEDKSSLYKIPPYFY